MFKFFAPLRLANYLPWNVCYSMGAPLSDFCV